MPDPVQFQTNAVKAELLYTLDGQHMENVITCEFPTTPEVTDAVALGDAIVGWFTTTFAGALPAALALQGVLITQIESPGGSGFQILYNTGCPVAGSGNGGAEPNNVSIAVKLSTAKHGRAYTGRLFQVALPLGHITANLIDSAFQGFLKTTYEELIQVIASAGWTWSVASYFVNKVKREMPVFTPITAVGIDPTIDSQRRRLPGRGR